MAAIQYVHPRTHLPLRRDDQGFVSDNNERFTVVRIPGHEDEILDFTIGESIGAAPFDLRAGKKAQESYRNFLDWLFATFDEDEAEFRKRMIGKLRLHAGDSVLVTGCGLGDDIPPILDAIGPTGRIYAQDLMPAMIRGAVELLHQKRPEQIGQVRFSVGDAQQLPFPNRAFDAAFHFGGINLFDSVKRGIAEMDRVTKVGGRVAVGDEGIAPWLRDTDYARMAITNNRLWSSAAPLDAIPHTASDVNVSWILGNCFWLIDFAVCDALPKLNPHIAHKGSRGGSMWTRHHGQLEGVTPATREAVIQAAAASEESVHSWLERALTAQIKTET